MKEPAVQVLVDFNNRNEQGRVRLGQAPPRGAAGRTVVAVDADGNRCRGRLARTPARAGASQWSVELDLATWHDSEVQWLDNPLVGGLPPRQVIAA